MQVKENNATNMGQPKPTNPCTTAKPTDTCGIPEIGVPPANSMPGYSDLQDIPLIIADKALVAPELGTNGLEAELGYPVGQPLLCNSCTPPGQANGGDPPPLDASAKYCTSQFFRNVCPAVWVPNPPSYCGRWSPEFFGPVNVVNGQVTPVLKLYPGWFRLRLVNGANTRTYKLQFKADLSSTLTKDLLIKCSKIATEAGYVKYPKPVATPLVMAPAERVELLCDLTGFKEVSRAWEQQCAHDGVVCACGLPDQSTLRCTCLSPAAAAACHPSTSSSPAWRMMWNMASREDATHCMHLPCTLARFP